MGQQRSPFPAPHKRQQHEYRRKRRDANFFSPGTMRHPITRQFVTHGSTPQSFLSPSREALTARAGGVGIAPGEVWFAGAGRGDTRCPRSETVVAGHQNIVESGVVRSDALRNRPRTSVEHPVCFRPWSNYVSLSIGSCPFREVNHHD